MATKERNWRFPRGWRGARRKDVDSLSGRLAERYRLSILSRLGKGKGWKVGGQWPRPSTFNLVAALRALFFFFFSPPAHRPTPGVDQMGWKRLCALLASRSARAKQGFFRRFPPGAECRLIDGRRIRDACLAGVGGDWWIRACSARGGTSLRLLGRIFDLERVFLGRILFLLLE